MAVYEDKDRDLDRSFMTIKILAACFTDLATAFSAASRKAAETAIAGIEEDAAKALRNLWGEDAGELRSIRDIGLLLKALTDPAISRCQQRFDNM